MNTLPILLFVALANAQVPPAVTASPAPLSEPVQAPSSATSPTAEPHVVDNPLAGIIEDYTYNPEAKRDPFAPFETLQGTESNSIGPIFPLQRFDLDQLKLVGVIWDVSHPKALLMDPSGKGHIVKINDRVGHNNGYVARIREGEIVIIESFKGVDGKTSYQTQTLKLGSE